METGQTATFLNFRRAKSMRLDLAQGRFQNVGVATQTMETRMDRFIRRENVRHYRELLKTVKNEAERQKILKLLADEQQKQKDAGDEIEGQ